MLLAPLSGTVASGTGSATIRMPAKRLSARLARAQPCPADFALAMLAIHSVERRYISAGATSSVCVARLQ